MHLILCQSNILESGIILKCKGDYESAERFMEEQVNLEEILDEDDEESEQTEVFFKVFFFFLKHF